MAVTQTNSEPTRRSRSAQKVVRRQQLIDATIDCINKDGISQTTLAKITQRAGASQGIVIFHFQNKESLFEQTLAFLTEEYQSTWRAAYKKARHKPIDKLCSMVTSAFHPSVFNRKKISVWYAFWGEAQSRPRYQRICGASDHEFSSTMLALCEEICATTGATMNPEVAALAIEGMIDGLWQNCLLLTERFDRKNSIRAIFDLVEVIFPDEKDVIRCYKPSKE
ncbi:MAG: transcriptional regulator BetI [Pseudomonadota bacterium]